VFRARDATLERDVALKLYRPELSRDPARRAALLDEARRMARVRHDHVLPVYGADVHHGRLGFWMELVEGETLEEALQRSGTVPADEACRIGASIAGALAAVHDAGIVHGDVKAANVIRDRDGKIFLTDFGSGAAVSSGSEESSGRSGTPLYMAPETLLSGERTPRSDLYSLGVLLFRMVTGR
jgi:serine/threonine protein kinase